MSIHKFAWIHLLLIVAVAKAHGHAFPSHVAAVGLQTNLLMSAEPAANSQGSRVHFEELDEG